LLSFALGREETQATFHDRRGRENCLGVREEREGGEGDSRRDALPPWKAMLHLGNGRGRKGGSAPLHKDEGKRKKKIPHQPLRSGGSRGIPPLEEEKKKTFR